MGFELAREAVHLGEYAAGVRVLGSDDPAQLVEEFGDPLVLVTQPVEDGRRFGTVAA